MVQVKDLTVEELQRLIRETVAETVRDLLAVPDASPGLPAVSVTEKESTTVAEGSVLARMGGMPSHLLQDGNLSDRENRQAVIEAHLRARHPSQS